MSENRNRTITPSKIGVFQGMTDRLKLIVRLLSDNRVSPWLKLLPVGTLIYLVVPDLAPGPIDDAFIIWLGTYLFVELCPPQVVEEHQRSLNPGMAPQGSDPVSNPEDIVDAEYWEEKRE